MIKTSFNFIATTILIFILNGCGHNRKVKPHYNKNPYRHSNPYYPQRGAMNANPYTPSRYNLNYQTEGYSNGVYNQRTPYMNSRNQYHIRKLGNSNQYQQKNTYTLNNDTPPLKIATNMDEINSQARNTKPMYIASQPMQIPPDVTFVNLNTYKNIIVNIINKTRASSLGGYPGTTVPVYWNRFLTKAAEAHARDMAVHKFISHLGSGGRTDYARKAPGVGSNFYERILFYGYPAQAGSRAGEILAITKDNIVGTKEVMPHFQHAIENFLKSPKHSYILKSPRLNRVGVAAYRSGNAIYWVVELVEERTPYQN